MYTYADFDIALPADANGHDLCYAVCPRCVTARASEQQHLRYLAVNLQKASWQCTDPACDWRGDLYQDRRQTQAKRTWAFPTNGSSPPPQTALLEKYAAHGIPAEVVVAHKITLARTFFPELDDTGTAVTFPYYRDGLLVNRRYVTTRPDGSQVSRFETGCERIMYHLDTMEGTTLIIANREVDVMALEVAGFRSVIAVPPLSDDLRRRNLASAFSFLDGMRDRLKTYTTIIFALDTDPLGQALSEELARRLGPKRCWRVAWPDGATTATAVFKEQGVDGLRDCLADRTAWPVKGIITVEDLSPALERLYLDGEQPGLSLGWTAIDQRFRIKPGEFSVITGIPAHGKSNWANHMMIRTAQLYGWRWAVFSPENYPLDRYLSFLVSQYMYKPFVGPYRLSFPELCEAEAWLHDHFTFLFPNDDEESPSLSALLELAQVQVERLGIQGFLIDPWNELDHNYPDRMTEQQYISESLSKVRRFSRQNKVHTVIVAHPTKLLKEKGGAYVGKVGPPTAYDIFGGSMWRNKPDNILCVWRDEDDETLPVEIHSQKIRFRGNGCSPGVGYLLFEKATATYADLGAMM